MYLNGILCIFLREKKWRKVANHEMCDRSIRICDNRRTLLRPHKRRHQYNDSARICHPNESLLVCFVFLPESNKIM